MGEEERRLNPDELLATLEQERKGQLTVFLGAAAGVGKTYAMLEVAQERLTEGVDVVAGYVEPHERPETMALLSGLPHIPSREIEYKGRSLREMDLDAILKRKPFVVLVDELAHSNVPGSRHLKRYQDVEELLAAGINVYTTLNIQHMESFNDIVAQITGVNVRETVPDSVLAQARLQLIDIPSEELIRRFQEGKVYVQQQAQHALGKFFRPGNINALRELAMRYAAQRVDRQMESYMRIHGIAGPWPAGERVMVCISTSPFGEQLIRFGHRVAVGMKAELLVVFVDTHRPISLRAEAREQLAKSLHLAQQMEGETLCLNGEDVVEELLAIARQRNVTQIIIGKPGKLSLRERLGGSIVDKIVRRSQNISVQVIPGDYDKVHGETKPSRRQGEKRHLLPYAEISVLIALLTAGGWFGREFLGLVNLAMLYLLPVLYAGVRWGERMGIFAALLAVLSYDFFEVPPVFTFSVADLRYLISFFIVIVIGAYTGRLSSRLHQQVNSSRHREAQTAALYALSKQMTAVAELDRVLQSVVRKVAETVEGEVEIFLPDEQGRLSLRASSEGHTQDTQDGLLDEREWAVAIWAFQHKQLAGKGTDTLGGAKACYLPLLSEGEVYGVLGVRLHSGGRYLEPEQERLLQAFASLTAMAVSRISLVEQAREARLSNESEKLRTALLNSISHDLRTPLASMIGAVSGLLEEEALYDADSRRLLLQTIQQGALRMNRLVNNLLDMARLESGMLKLRKEWCSLEEIISTALERLSSASRTRQVRLDLPEDLPLVKVNFVLLEQVVVNLLDNALKYSRPESEIIIQAIANPQTLEVSVQDWGAPIPAEDLERVFDKFYRVRAPRQISGTGLGLAICKGIIELHGGKIWAENGQDGSVRLAFVLPLKEKVPELPPASGGEADG